MCSQSEAFPCFVCLTGIASSGRACLLLTSGPAPGLTHRHPPCAPVSCSGEKWKHTRNAWQPFFSQGSIARSSGLMAESAGRLCRQLGRAAEEGREVDIWRELGRMTMDVVGTTAFG